jgi:hypothetical protein
MESAKLQAILASRRNSENKRSSSAGRPRREPDIIGCDLQDVPTESTLWGYARTRLKAGVDVSIGLKADFQANRGGASFLAGSKRRIMSCGIGYAL